MTTLPLNLDHYYQKGLRSIANTPPEVQATPSAEELTLSYVAGKSMEDQRAKEFSENVELRKQRLADVARRAEERLARAPVLLPPGRIIKVDRHGEPESASGARDEFRRHAEVYRRWGIEPEDLIAYERAFAADRVRYFGMDK